MPGMSQLLSDRAAGLFRPLGDLIARRWLTVLSAWIVVVAGAAWFAPDWDQITLDGDFAYLPDSRTSVRGQRLLAEAFPDQAVRSQVVLIVARDHGVLDGPDYDLADLLAAEFAPSSDPANPVIGVLSYNSEVLGDKHISPPGDKGQATLVVLQLRTELSALGNRAFMRSLYARLGELRQEANFPEGLQLAVTGSAALGYDMLDSAVRSTHNTALTTVVFVVLILLLVYRAPGLVLIPLLTIAASLALSKSVVAMLVQGSDRYGWYDYEVFKTTEVFLTVMLFGAGTNFCLFLIARYREELARGKEQAEALAYALGQVGEALLGSAGTTIFGLAMMRLAEYGKFRHSGPTIALSLAIALAACITLTPALLRAAGKWAFWPWGAAARRSPQEPREVLFFEESSRTGTARFWRWISRWILARPGWILIGALALLAAPAWNGLSVDVNYDLAAELNADRPSMQGAQVLRRYYPAGEMGPITVLARLERPVAAPRADDEEGTDAPAAKERAARPIFETAEGKSRIAMLTKFLYEIGRRDERGNEEFPVAAVCSLTEPLGSPPGSFNPLSRIGRQKLAVLEHPKTKATFLSQSGKHAYKVARFDIILHHNPFSQEAMADLELIERALTELSQDTSSPWANAIFEFVGITAGIRDLEEVTLRDRYWIQIYVVVTVLGVLIAILRRPLLCVYLVATVLLSYYATLGTTDLLFAQLVGSAYQGLDWKAPLYLFVILMAVGQDYNIYLLTRVFEEQSRLGIRRGLREALAQTGGIITSCGVIMAGTFVSMITGSLRGMHELGFALSFGIMLDTLIVRTILTPALLALRRDWMQAAPERPPEQTAVPPPATPALSSPPPQ